MKKLVKLLGIIAFVAVIGISMSACVVGVPPDTPTGLTAVALSSSSIGLSWNSVAAADGYYVYSSSSAYGTYTLVGTVTTNSATHYNLSSGTTYYYRVSAYNSFGESGQSSYDYATTSGGSSSATALSYNTWYSNYIYSMSTTHYYSFYASGGNTYYVKWQDYDTNTSYADVQVGLRRDGSSTYAMSIADRPGTNQFSYYVSTSGYYIIEVKLYRSSYTGYYQIGYY